MAEGRARDWCWRRKMARWPVMRKLAAVVSWKMGREAASKALASLWTHAWASAGLPQRAVDGLFIGSGSILHSDDIETNCEMAVVNGMASAGHVRAENDAWNGLAGALGGRPGLFLIAGTGAVCLGRNSSGQTWRAGGWGHLLNDVGSAYQMGAGGDGGSYARRRWPGPAHFVDGTRLPSSAVARFETNFPVNCTTAKFRGLAWLRLRHRWSVKPRQAMRLPEGSSMRASGPGGNVSRRHDAT